MPHAVAKTTGVSFIAGADLRTEEREQYRAEFGIQTFDSVAAMCESSELDAVCDTGHTDLRFSALELPVTTR